MKLHHANGHERENAIETMPCAAFTSRLWGSLAYAVVQHRPCEDRLPDPGNFSGGTLWHINTRPPALEQVGPVGSFIRHTNGQWADLRDLT